MVTIQKIDFAMFPEVSELLLEFRSKHLTVEDWKNIFNYKWDHEETYCGYGLFDGQKLVGYIGLIFCQRWIDKKKVRFCNVTSWIVRKSYRAYSLLLMQPVLRLKNHTITDLTPSRAVYAIEKRLGFRGLDSRLKMFLPLRFPITNKSINGCHITMDKDLIERKLEDNDFKLFYDHMPYKCQHLITFDAHEYCYIIYTRVEGSKIPYCHIQYISNPNLFSKYIKTIQREIVRNNMTPLIVVDSRLVKHLNLPFSYKLPFRSIKLYRSANLRPEQIDNLYSELVLLNLSAIPKPMEIFLELINEPIRKRDI